MENGLYPQKTVVPAPEAGGDTVGSMVGGLYVRIVIMQVAIIAGAHLRPELRLDRAAADRHRPQDARRHGALRNRGLRRSKA